MIFNPSIMTVAETVYKHSRKVVQKILSAPPASYNPLQVIYDVFSLYSSIPLAVPLNMDNDLKPEYIRFYRKDLVNGARSETHDAIVRLNKRKTNAGMFFTVERKRG
jgi:hypothetical protein